ncbi:hypothetical protein PR202_gb27506 [Eleusine coracana subsp. coracana]|uniref:Uncharacterized protein n=1 Tax=Eleusine coracana subsp. coracana TaxID=191504 RepID=A0AAV5FUN0_ELECO|nr:hypothetical protein PR202_gb27506 [Eleusine coracana subsp. coracana]
MIIMCAWVIWKHRNSCIFEGASPNMNELIRTFKHEQHWWCFAGARGLRALGLGQVALESPD